MIIYVIPIILCIALLCVFMIKNSDIKELFAFDLAMVAIMIFFLWVGTQTVLQNYIL